MPHGLHYNKLYYTNQLTLNSPYDDDDINSLLVKLKQLLGYK